MSVEPSLAGEALSHTATVVFIVVGFVLIIVGSVGNVLIVATILVNKTLRVLHNVFVVNLAVADFLVTAYFLPLQVSAFVDGKYPVSDSSACQFVGFSIVWLFVTSLLSIAAISINRFIKVCHQRVYHQIFSKTNTLLACGAVWVLAFLCTFPPLVGWGRFHFDEKNHYCGFDRSADLGYTLFLLCVSIALPAALIFICNFAIYRHVLLSKRRVMSFATGTPPKLSDASVPASKPTTGQGTGSRSTKPFCGNLSQKLQNTELP
nr:hypothetical protein BaRGS_030654 [Batillaria attramentaria]